MNEPTTDQARFEADCRTILEAVFQLRKTGATESALIQEVGCLEQRRFEECLTALLSAEKIAMNGEVYIVTHQHVSMPNPIPFDDIFDDIGVSLESEYMFIGVELHGNPTFRSG